MKHTPGTFHLCIEEEYHVRCASGDFSSRPIRIISDLYRELATIRCFSDPRGAPAPLDDKEEAEANALLFSQSPRLLSLLKEMIDAIDGYSTFTRLAEARTLLKELGI